MNRPPSRRPKSGRFNPNSRDPQSRSYGNRDRFDSSSYGSPYSLAGQKSLEGGRPISMNTGTIAVLAGVLVLSLIHI